MTSGWNGAPVPNALQHELAQRAGFVGGGLRRHAEKRVRDLEWLRHRDAGPDAGKPDADAQPIVGALERCAPGARPHQPAEELVAPIVDQEERDEFLGGAAFGAQIESFPRLEVVLGEDEGVHDRAVAVGRVAAQAAQPPHIAERHRHVPGDEIVEGRAVAARARHPGPGFDRRRAGITGVDAGEQQALRAVLEGEGEHDAVVGRHPRRVDQADGAAAGQRDSFAAGGEAEVGGRRDVPRPAGHGVEEALQRQGARRIEADDELEVRAADRPDVAAVLVRDECVSLRGDDRGAIGGERRSGGEQTHENCDRGPTGH